MIRFYCACGKRLKVSKQDAGKIAKCSQCGAKVRVPQAPAPSADPREALAAALHGERAPADRSGLPVAEVVAPAKRQPAAAPQPAAREDLAAAGLAALAQAAAPWSPRDEPADPDPSPRRSQAADGLAALAQAVASAPVKESDPMARVRQRVGAANGPASAVLTRGGPGHRKSHTFLIVGIGVGVVVIGILIAVLVHSAGYAPEKPPPGETSSGSHVGSTAGELFPGVPSK